MQDSNFKQIGQSLPVFRQLSTDYRITSTRCHQVLRRLKLKFHHWYISITKRKRVLILVIASIAAGLISYGIWIGSHPFR
jgi:hypothetical protein